MCGFQRNQGGLRWSTSEVKADRPVLAAVCIEKGLVRFLLRDSLTNSSDALVQLRLDAPQRSGVNVSFLEHDRDALIVRSLSPSCAPSRSTIWRSCGRSPNLQPAGGAATGKSGSGCGCPERCSSTRLRLYPHSALPPNPPSPITYSYILLLAGTLPKPVAL